MGMTPNCQLCGSSMVKSTQRSGAALGCATSLIVLAIGLGLAIFAFPCGTVIGVPLCIIALFIGGKTKRVWKCSGCSTIVERA